MCRIIHHPMLCSRPRKQAGDAAIPDFRSLAYTGTFLRDEMNWIWKWLKWNSLRTRKYETSWYPYANHGAGIWIPTFAPFLWPSFVGKYSSTMEHMGTCNGQDKDSPINHDGMTIAHPMSLDHGTYLVIDCFFQSVFKKLGFWPFWRNKTTLERCFFPIRTPFYAP